MKSSGVLGVGGGEGKAPLSSLTCCKLKVAQKGVVLTSWSQTFKHDVVLEITDWRVVLYSKLNFSEKNVQQ